MQEVCVTQCRCDFSELHMCKCASDMLMHLCVMQERDDSEQLVRELMRKTKKLQEEQATAEQSLKVPATETKPSAYFFAAQASHRGACNCALNCWCCTKEAQTVSLPPKQAELV